MMLIIIIRIRVDYSMLSEAIKELEEADEIKRKADKLQKAINTLQNTVDKIQAPNMRVSTWTFRDRGHILNIAIVLAAKAIEAGFVLLFQSREA